jgi:hypothetical protein
MNGDAIAPQVTCERNARTIFLLSPANLSGRRANLLLSPKAKCALAIRLRATGATLGEVFSFISGLYFRGKLAYASAFARNATTGRNSVFVITAGRGLLSPETWIEPNHLHEMASVAIDLADSNYRLPLERDLLRIASEIHDCDRVVLLGSVATPKYVEPLAAVFGKRLMMPADFVARGDMSRGALMLRAVRDGKPLAYIELTECAGRSARKAKPSAQSKRRIAEDTIANSV